MQCDDLQVAAVREEAVTELSKHIKQAQRLEELREADAVSLIPALHGDDMPTTGSCLDTTHMHTTLENV